MQDTPPLVPTWKILLGVAGLLVVCIAGAIVVALSYGHSPPPPAAGEPRSDRWHGTGTIRGTVRDKNGAAVPGVRLMAVLFPPPGAPNGSSLDATRETTSGSDGSYVFTGLPDLDTSVFGDGRDRGCSIMPVDLRQIRVRPDCIVELVLRPDGETITAADVELREPDPSRTITVRIVDAAGEPVWPDSVKYAMEGTGWSSSGDAESRRRADGWLSVEIPDHGTVGVASVGHGKSVKKCLLVFSSVKFGRRVVEVPPPPTEPVEITFESPALLAVTGDGFPATPPPTAVSVDLDDGRALSVSSDADHAAHGTLDATGREELGPLAPGTYVLSATFGSYPRRVLARRTVVLVSGVNEVTLPLGEMCGTLTVEAGAERKFWFVTLRPPGKAATLAKEQTDATGRAVFGMLRPGPYDIDIDGETRQVEVAAQTTLTW